jgi:excisionase family DNA binding protein
LENKYLNFNEAAKYLGISVFTLRRWVCNEGFPVAKIGRVVRIDKEDMDKWIKSRVGVK